MNAAPGLFTLGIVCTGRSGLKHRHTTSFGLLDVAIPPDGGRLPADWDDVLVYSRRNGGEYDPELDRFRYRCKRCGTDVQLRRETLERLARHGARAGVSQLDISALHAIL